jgi:hypothetical protein
MRLEINVHGAEVAVNAAPDKPLWRACSQAFPAAGIVGQPLENWEIRDQDGRLLDTDQQLSEFEFDDSTQLSLTPKAGVAG